MIYYSAALVSEEGIFTYVSPSVEKMLGYTPAELPGRGIRDFFPPDYFSEIVVQFALVTQVPDNVVTVEHLYLHKSSKGAGTTFFVSLPLSEDG